ncbi:MAG: SsrA-binding protein SmpB [Candidatus Babeliales bacterium]
MKIIATNKKALHDYEIKEKFEAGIVLTGDEVKSLRAKQVSLNEAFATIHAGEINLINCHIAPYSHSFSKEDKSRRTRQLLLHKKEINRLIGDISKKGLTLIPLKIYFNDRGFVKLELGLAKHKKAESKKKELKEKDIKRQAEREMKTKFKIK